MSFNYVGITNPNLVCCICRAPFMNPYTTRTCAHTFCRDCILTALEVTPQCPIDRSPLGVESLNPADPVLRNLVDELLVECPNNPEGCSEICQRLLMDAHVRDKCSYALVRCPEGMCKKQILRKDASSHSHEDNSTAQCSECGAVISNDGSEVRSTRCKIHSTTTCEACLSEIPSVSLSKHKDTCLDTIIPCPHAPHGCSWTGRRTSLQTTHISACAYESIKGFFAIHDTKMSVLTQENLQLRHQINVLQGMVSIMQRELDAVKTVLGPWYRPDPVLPSSMVATEYREPTADVTVSPDGGVDGLATDLSFASYFPPVEEESIQGVLPTDSSTSPSFQHHQHRTSISISSPSSSQSRQRPASTAPLNLQIPFLHSSQPVPSPLGSGSAPPIATLPGTTASASTSTSSASVAPLTISTTLYGTLSSLHTSILSLASALDSLGRHHDVALTTEAMRMGEEVRSLRAVVNGLRMQVHAIMVDRNTQVTYGRSGEGASAPSPGPVSAANLPAHPSAFYQQTFPGMAALASMEPWTQPSFFGVPMPRFAPSTSSAPPGPVTKL